jgi:hypothetical protein
MDGVIDPNSELHLLLRCRTARVAPIGVYSPAPLALDPPSLEFPRTGLADLEPSVCDLLLDPREPLGALALVYALC